MDKETKKGLRVLAIILLAVVLLFLFAGGENNKASCIADALAGKMERANVNKHCGLTTRN